jgi:hypothetical protein
MCHVASCRKTTIVRTIQAAIVAILPNIMTFSLHAKSFSCPDDPILPPQLQLSHHKEHLDSCTRKARKKKALVTYFENNIIILVKKERRSEDIESLMLEETNPIT